MLRPPGYRDAVPRADVVSLTADGLDMPAVDHLFNKNSLNVNLDRWLGGNPGHPTDRSLMGLWVNFVRLTDKALREYDAARTELMAYVSARDGAVLHMSPYVRAIDHMENCVSATHRAVLDARALQTNGVGRKGPRLTEGQERRLRGLRNTIEHTDERLIGSTARPKSPVFQPGQPFSLRLANRVMVIGQDMLTYKELVSAMTKIYRTIESIRGPSVRPGETWTNASLRTDAGAPPPNAGSMQPTEYLKALSRLLISH